MEVNLLAISATVWHPGWVLRNFPMTIAWYVLIRPKASSRSVPPTAPSVTMLDAIDSTPEAKMILRKIKVALYHETVRKLTPPSTDLKTSVTGQSHLHVWMGIASGKARDIPKLSSPATAFSPLPEPPSS